jgi:acetyl-CoA carboxylase biotin carboxylase subunit
MISKLAAYGKDRAEAIDRMRRALQEYEVGGIKTTLPFFREIMEDPEFIEGRLDTGFISRFNERKKAKEISQTEKDMALIASALSYSGKQKTVNQNHNSNQKQSRWAMSGRIAALNNRL